MNSIFESIDRKTQQHSKFWEKWEDALKNEIFSGYLYEVSKGRVAKMKLFSLTENFLYKNKFGNQKRVPIEWKVVEPFIEENKTQILYGFRLGHKWNYRDFYVSNTKSLDSWIEKLSSFCIMRDIEDDYYFIKSIGKGRSAKIYFAERVEDMKKFAIKSTKKNRLFENLDYTELIANEINIMRKCSHPNIIKLHRVYESETHAYLVLDYVEGGDLLNRILKKKKFSEEAVIRLSYKFMRVLEYLDSVNIIHRDIKLENILLISEDNDYDFKLADFGLSVEVKETLTKKCGSPGYIAPEVLQGLPYGTKVDVFSFGIVIYIMLTGRMPFSGKTSQEVLKKNIDCKINFNDIIWNYFSIDCLNFVAIITQKDQCCRISARDMLNHPWLREIGLKIEKIGEKKTKGIRLNKKNTQKTRYKYVVINRK